MKKVLLIVCCLLAGLSINAQDINISIETAKASSAETGEGASLAIDGETNTFWHSSYRSGATKFPVTFTITLGSVQHVDYVRYVPRQDGSSNGHWSKVDVAYCPATTGSNFTTVGSYTLNGTSTPCDFWLTEKGVTCGKIQFTIHSGDGGFASAAEIEAYAVDNSTRDLYAKYFTDDIFSKLKPEVKNSDGIKDATLKALVDNILKNAESYKKFRVGEYEPYLSTETLIDILKVSSYYNRYENPTGIYLKAGESCFVAVSGINTQYPVGLTIKNWVENENSSSYSLRNGLNQIKASTEGNVFVNYYTDDFEKAPNVKVHFINAPVQGYWDQATMTNKDWVELLKGRSQDDNTVLITRSEHAQLAYPVSAWLKYCPTNIDSTMTLYQQVQWAERDILGLEKYGRQVKNRQLYYATTYGFMAAGGEGAYCNVNSLDAIMVPDSKRFDFWGVGHEWGHNNQVTTGFKWSGCGETTNNIYASWGQIHFTGNPGSLRLEDESSGIDEYSGMRGGRMQTYFEEALRKGVAWQLQDGPDYHGTTPDTKTVTGYDADGKNIGQVTTTSRNYDHFVKLVPFWQLNLWGTLAGKCPDIIPMVIESIRTTKEYSAYHNTNGKKQINWMKLACDSAKIDLLPFFEKAGMLRPIHAYIEDYNAGWNIITEEMIAELKEYVKKQGYPAFTEEINYINGHNYPIYRDRRKLEVPKTIGEGCKLNGNKMTVQHSSVKNAVAFETYNCYGELLRITMYGLGSNNEHSFTQVLYPTNKDKNLSSAYIMAVGYDGTRLKIYEEEEFKERFLDLLEQAKKFVTRIDTTGNKVGYLRPEDIIEFAPLVAEIDSIFENTDERKMVYEKWSSLLEENIATLLDKCAPIIPNRFYSLTNCENTNSRIGNSTSGLKSYNYEGKEMPKSMIWKLIQSDAEGVYYLQHYTTGRYISSAQGQTVKADSLNIAAAIPFTLKIAAPGEFYIQNADNESIKLYDDDTRISAGTQTGDNAIWFMQMEEEQKVEDLLALPDTSTSEQITTYYLIRTDNGHYAYGYNPKSSREKGRILSDMYSKPDEFNYWFYFKQGSQEGKYTMYNYGTGFPVTEVDSALYIHEDEEVLPEFTIAQDEQGTGLIISSEEGAWLMQKAFYNDAARISQKEHTAWKLQRLYTFNPIYEPLTSIIISQTEATLEEGSTITLSVETAPIYATDRSVTWSSTDESVATVDANGEVTAIAEGHATIIVTANDNSSMTATCNLTVHKIDTDIITVTEPTSAPSIKSYDGVIIIDGVRIGTIVNVYNMTGRLIATTTATDSSVEINTELPKGHVAIITAGPYNAKVQIR